MNWLICWIFGHKQPLRQQQFTRPILSINGQIIEPHTIIPKFREGHGFWFCDRCGKRIFYSE